MNKVSWQEYHGFNYNEMDLISLLVKEYNGKITAINQRILSYEIFAYNR